MKITDKVVVVTGGANGIGRAFCRRFAAEGARAVVVADIDGSRGAGGSFRVRRDGGGDGCLQRADVMELVARATEKFGRIDLFCSDAGIGIEGGVETSTGEWQRIWEINFMAHVYAARAVLPAMLERHEGICCRPFRPRAC